MNLVFDIKHLIASINSEAWYWMVQLDDEFRIYASSKEGIKEYKKIHTEIFKNEYFTDINYLENRIAKMDQPLLIMMCMHGILMDYYIVKMVLLTLINMNKHGLFMVKDIMKMVLLLYLQMGESHGLFMV